jgi:general secretion pathway protein N
MRSWSTRVRRALPWAIIAILAAGGTWLAMLPAAWVAPRFAEATGQRVLLAGPEGSLWHGFATLSLAAGPDAGAPVAIPGRVEWHTAFWPLFTGRLRMSMHDAAAMPEPVTVDATLRGATVSSGALGVPASILTGLGAPFNTLDFQGDVRLSWDTWRLMEQRAYGRLRISLDNMASRISMVKPLGSYLVVLDANGGDGTIVLSTQRGPLMLSGNGGLGAGGFSFAGRAAAAPGSEEHLAALLSLLGRPQHDGSISLTFQR